MPKNITQVQWEASGLPSGLNINPETGVISGNTHEAGEYVVPVHVQTNYGSDTKDVKIIVNNPAYNVFAIGANAQEWRENSEPDKYGFYPLNMPKAYKLVPHYQGFLARTNNDEYKNYFCGLIPTIPNYSPASESYNFRFWSTPQNKISGYGDTIGDIERVQFGLLQSIAPTGKLSSQYVAWVKRTPRDNVYNNVALFSGSRWLYSELTDPDLNSYDELPRKVSNASKSLNTTLGESPYFYARNAAFIEDDHIVIMSMPSIGDGSGFNKGEQNLGYIPIKKFSSYCNGTPYTRVASNAIVGNPKVLQPVFQYLSEDKLLDNNAENFTLGIIKDAWVCQTAAYVITEENILYEYDNTSLTWNYLGIYNIKKLEINTPNVVFFITKDGKLYHKGNSVLNITEEHTSFTQIFPDCYFHDFTYSPEKTTLTVIKE